MKTMTTSMALALAATVAAQTPEPPVRPFVKASIRFEYGGSPYGGVGQQCCADVPYPGIAAIGKPVIGTTWQVRVTGSYPGAPSFLMVGPRIPPVHLTTWIPVSAGRLWCDPWVFLPVSTTTGPFIPMYFPIPNDLALLTTPLVFQPLSTKLPTATTPFKALCDTALEARFGTVE